jgi:hypothetical protein
MENYWHAANWLVFRGAYSKIQHGISRKLGLGKESVIIADQECTNMQWTNMRTQKLMKTILAALTNERIVPYF